MSRLLKVNTTLKTLDLSGKENMKREKEIINDGRMTGNDFKNDGAKVMSEMLQVNTTLTSLNLSGEEYNYGKRKGMPLMI